MDAQYRGDGLKNSGIDDIMGRFATQFLRTKVLQLLVILAGLHLQVEFVLIRAQLKQILTCLGTIRLKKVLNPI